MRTPQKSVVSTVEHEAHVDGSSQTMRNTVTTSRSGNPFARKTTQSDHTVVETPTGNGGVIRDFKTVKSEYRDPRLPFGKRNVSNTSTFGRTERQGDGASVTEHTRVTDARTTRRGRVLNSQQSEQSVTSLRVPGQGREIERGEKVIWSTDKRGNQTTRVLPGSTTSR